MRDNYPMNRSRFRFFDNFEVYILERAINELKNHYESSPDQHTFEKISNLLKEINIDILRR